MFVEEYAQFYGAMTMNREHMVNMRKDGLPYEEMGYSGPPPNRCFLGKSEISKNFSGQMDDVRFLS